MSKSKLLWLLVWLEVEFAVVLLIIMVFVAVMGTSSRGSMHGSRTVSVSEAVNVTGSIAVEVGSMGIVVGTIGTISIIRVRNIVGIRSRERMRMFYSMVSHWVRYIAITISSTWVVISSSEDVMFSVNEIIIITVASFASHAVDSGNFCVVISAIERSHAVMVLIRSVLSGNMRAALISISEGRVRNAWSWSNARSAESELVGDVAFGIKKIEVTREVVIRSLTSHGTMSSFVGSWLLMPFDTSA